MKKKEEIVEELKGLLNDPRTGLKESSDTNKTRYAILALFDEVFDRRQDDIDGLMEWSKGRKHLGISEYEDDASKMLSIGYNNAISDIVHHLQALKEKV
jgi:hypothetical protein